MNKPLFAINVPSTKGKPFVYSHGLGGPELLSSELVETLGELGYSVSNICRDDEAILSTEQPQDVLIEETARIMKEIADKAGQKITVGGGSLGTFTSLVAASQIPDSIERIIAMDAFFTPDDGFRQIEKNMFETYHAIQEHIVKGKTIKSPWDLLPCKFADAPDGMFPVLLTGDRWMYIPKGVHEKFTPIDGIESVEQLSCPIHLVWGEHDSFILPDRKPDSFLQAESVSHYEIPEANHNDWKGSAEAIKSALQFLKN